MIKVLPGTGIATLDAGVFRVPTSLFTGSFRKVTVSCLCRKFSGQKRAILIARARMAG